MIAVETVIAKLDADLTYTVQMAKDVLPNWQDLTALPIIFVGYHSIDCKEPNVPLESTIFNTNGENLVQNFEIHIVCSVSAFRTVWINVYKSLIGWNPVATEIYHSGFTFAQGGKMGISNSKLWDVSVWRIGFPTNQGLV